MILVDSYRLNVDNPVREGRVMTKQIKRTFAVFPALADTQATSACFTSVTQVERQARAGKCVADVLEMRGKEEVQISI